MVEVADRRSNQKDLQAGGGILATRWPYHSVANHPDHKGKSAGGNTSRPAVQRKVFAVQRVRGLSSESCCAARESDRTFHTKRSGNNANIREIARYTAPRGPVLAGCRSDDL